MGPGLPPPKSGPGIGGSGERGLGIGVVGRRWKRCGVGFVGWWVGLGGRCAKLEFVGWRVGLGGRVGVRGGVADGGGA